MNKIERYFWAFFLPVLSLGWMVHLIRNLGYWNNPDIGEIIAPYSNKWGLVFVIIGDFLLPLSLCLVPILYMVIWKIKKSMSRKMLMALVLANLLFTGFMFIGNPNTISTMTELYHSGGKYFLLDDYFPFIFFILLSITLFFLVVSLIEVYYKRTKPKM